MCAYSGGARPDWAVFKFTPVLAPLEKSVRLGVFVEVYDGLTLILQECCYGESCEFMLCSQSSEIPLMGIPVARLRGVEAHTVQWQQVLFFVGKTDVPELVRGDMNPFPKLFNTSIQKSATEFLEGGIRAWRAPGTFFAASGVSPGYRVHKCVLDFFRAGHGRLKTPQLSPPSLTEVAALEFQLVDSFVRFVMQADVYRFRADMDGTAAGDNYSTCLEDDRVGDCEDVSHFFVRAIKALVEVGSRAGLNYNTRVAPRTAAECCSLGYALGGLSKRLPLFIGCYARPGGDPSQFHCIAAFSRAGAGAKSTVIFIDGSVDLTAEAAPVFVGHDAYLQLGYGDLSFAVSKLYMNATPPKSDLDAFFCPSIPFFTDPKQRLI